MHLDSDAALFFAKIRAMHPDETLTEIIDNAEQEMLDPTETRLAKFARSSRG